MSKINNFNLLDGITFISIGMLFCYFAREVELQCIHISEMQNKCQVVSHSLLESHVITVFYNVKGANLKQQIYEPLPGKRSIVDSRIIIITETREEALGDNYTHRLDLKVVEEINNFSKQKTVQSINILVFSDISWAYIGLIPILAGFVLIGKSVFKAR